MYGIGELRAVDELGVCVGCIGVVDYGQQTAISIYAVVSDGGVVGGGWPGEFD